MAHIQDLCGKNVISTFLTGEDDLNGKVLSIDNNLVWVEDSRKGVNAKKRILCIPFSSIKHILKKE